MREAALCIQWGRVITGREKLALDLFGRGIGYLQSHVGTGRLRELRIYGSKGDAPFYAFLLVHGPEEELEKLQKSEEFMRLQLQIGRVVEDLRLWVLLCGESEQAKEVGRMAQAWREIGVI